MINNRLLQQDEETIIAQCTPQGSGAIALLRLSGHNAIEIAAQIGTLASGKKLTEMPTHTIHYGSIVDQQRNIIDRVMFFLMHGPKTFTGQHVVEITTHNNPFIINAVIEAAIAAGARPAQEGEFSKRAFLNNKIDLVQAEAINELIHAQTQAALKASLNQLEGSLSHTVAQLESELIKALAYSEASFEFIEEEDIEFGQQIETIINATIKKIEQLRKTADNQKRIREGVRVALLGSVNTGKSSLFNALLGQKRAIVTNVPGTTRDVIEAGMYTNGTYLTLIDTAGLRQTDNKIEQEGIKRSSIEAKGADIVLLVYDGSIGLNNVEQKIYQDILTQYKDKIIVIRNKIDLSHAQQYQLTQQEIAVSCTNKKNIKMLERTIKEKISKLFEGAQSPFLLNKRQHSLLLVLEKKLKTINPMLKMDIQYELISLHIKDALTHLSEISGKTISQRSIDALFKQFCVGK